MTSPTPESDRRLELIIARYFILARSSEPWDQQHAADLAWLFERQGVVLPPNSPPPPQ